jgi:hypothetical protein
MAWNGVSYLAIVLTTSLLSGTQAADLKTVDRRVEREPKYQSGKPEYCLLVFGARAEARVWLVKDGDVLHVDRNGNGDLTEVGEKVTRFVPKIGAARKVFEKSLLFRTGPLAPKASPRGRQYPDLLLALDPGESVMVLEHPEWPQVVPGRGLKFAASPKEAPIIHFDGPLTLKLFEGPEGEPGQSLIRGQEVELGVLLGTPGLGRGTVACRPHRRLTIDSFLKATNEAAQGDPAPADLKVVAEVRYPGGSEAVPAARHVLESRC